MSEQKGIQDNEDTQLEAIHLEVKQPSEFVYSNVANVAVSQMDIRVAFAEALPNGTATTKVGIVMSPEHASALVLLLMQHLRLYERNFGEIRLPQWKQLKERAVKPPVKGRSDK
jgi:Protein of unknown function (DUF3467)